MRFTRSVWLAVLGAAMIGCGSSSPSDSEQASASQTAGQQAAEAVAAAFVPRADQFGVRAFKVVYALEGQQRGTRTMWVEDHGARVAIEDDVTIGTFPKKSLYYWDGQSSHMQDLPDGKVSAIRIRRRDSEPTSFATTAATGLEMVGYERIGSKNVAGRDCEHWKNEKLNYEGCRWSNIELEFLNGAGTAKIIQRAVATEFVEGETIPDRFKALAGG
jgi:hypothetical protein